MYKSFGTMCSIYKKVLGNNTTYFFQDEYIYDENTNWIKPKNGIIALNEDFLILT